MKQSSGKMLGFKTVDRLVQQVTQKQIAKHVITVTIQNKKTPAV